MKNKTLRAILMIVSLLIGIGTPSFICMGGLGLLWLYWTRRVPLNHTKRSMISLFLFGICYVLMIVLSQAMNPVSLTLNLSSQIVLKGIWYLGMFWVGFSMRREDWFYTTHNQLSVRQHQAYLIIMTLVITSLFIPFLLAFSPGNMYIDSYAQWGQAVGGLRLSNWHPLLSTGLLYVSYLIGGTPLLYTLVQLICCIAVMVYLAYVLLKLGFKRWVITWCQLFLCFATLLIPNMITIYKDNWYNLALFLLSIYLFQCVHSKGNWLHEKKWRPFCLGIVLLLCMLVRHNGIYVIAGFAVIGLLCARPYRHLFIKYSLILVLLYGVYQGPMIQALKVKPASESEKYSMVLQHIGAVLVQEKPLAADDAFFLSTILSLPLWQEQYTPVMVDPVKFHPSFHKEVIEAFPQQLMKVWLRILRAYPFRVLWAEMQQVRPLWDIQGWEHGLPGTQMFHYGLSSPKALYDPYQVQYTFAYQGLRQSLTDISLYLNPQDRQTKPSVTTLSAWSVYTILGIMCYFVSKKRWAYLLIGLPVLLNIGVLLLAMPAYNMRYLLNIIMIAMLLVLVAVKSKFETVAKEDNNETTSPYI